VKFVEDGRTLIRISMSWIFWALMSAVFAGATAILAKVGVSGVSSNLATAIRTSVVLLLAWSLVLVTRETGALSSLTKRTWLFLTFSGLATGLSWLCYFRALQLGEASRVAPVDKLSVVFVLVFASLFLDEPFTFRTVLGTALIVSGAVLLALK
jgi:transporter family protein